MKVLVVSDIHGNYEALNAVLESAGGWDSLWVLGDLVDYGPEPHVVVDVVRGLDPDLVLMGNHDYAMAYGADCMCAEEVRDLSVYTRQFVSARLLSKEQLEWLRNLPRSWSGVVGGLKVFAAHGSPRNNLFGYLRPSLPRSELLLALTPSMYSLRPRPVDSDVVLVGHTHAQFDIRVDSIRVVNPGSVGQPRDGDPRAAYAIVETGNWGVELRRVEYDVMKTVRKLRELNLDREHLSRLERILVTGRL
ncbi:MAG: metallophosphoesterase family protein [Sulfolobales archaeon]|nr:metallophosphatase family protein [Sulfolobales archaeon]MCX8208567.1 metallophosphatase family protein [Sulfolobales archaeon]MDW8010913.1 metallophosphoesterase family protein [Sulfolobales archaeon]